MFISHSSNPETICFIGCDVSRLREFILSFYPPGQAIQNVDDAFYGFVWDQIIKDPKVIVGTVPQGVNAEVYIAQQTSARRKAKEKGDLPPEQNVAPGLIPVPDARTRSLDDLKQQYGSGLHIAVDAESSFVAITGSHTRVSTPHTPHKT